MNHAAVMRVKPSIIGLIGLSIAWLAVSPLRAADTAVDANADVSQLQEVVVTGSRIAVPVNGSATSPIQVVTSQEIQLEGQSDTTNVINRLPQIMINPGVDIGLSHAMLRRDCRQFGILQTETTARYPPC